MEVFALTVNEDIETEIDEELPDELVSEGKKLEIKNMIDMEAFDIVERANGKKASDLRRSKRSRLCESQIRGKSDCANERCGPRILCWHTTDLVRQVPPCNIDRQTAATFILVRCDTGLVVRIPARRR